ncbi:MULTISPECIES: hypothetical protein [unclassified Streptomyces]|uniref:hypothetical protein n=1 Tax=unclassified Streptomyces TaxID=2593676 RepID=UPI000D14D9B2
MPLELGFSSGQTCWRRVERWQQAGTFDHCTGSYCHGHHGPARTRGGGERRTGGRSKPEAGGAEDCTLKPSPQPSNTEALAKPANMAKTTVPKST